MRIALAARSIVLSLPLPYLGLSRLLPANGDSQ